METLGGYVHSDARGVVFRRNGARIRYDVYSADDPDTRLMSCDAATLPTLEAFLSGIGIDLPDEVVEALRER